MAETILRPQKTFQPVEELDGICCAVQGFAKEAPLGWKQWDKLSTAVGLATWVQGTMRKLCSEEAGWLQRQTMQQSGACNKKKSLQKLRSRFQGITARFLAFLKVLGIIKRLWQKNDRYWV